MHRHREEIIVHDCMVKGLGVQKIFEHEKSLI